MKSKFLIATAIAVPLIATSLAVAGAAERGHSAPAAARAAPPRAAVHAPAPMARPVVRAPAPQVRVQPRATFAPSKSQARVGQPSAERERKSRIGPSAQRSLANTVRKSDRDRQNVRPERAVTASPHPAAAVRLSGEQRSRIQEVIRGQHSSPRTARADFDIRVGARIPHDRLRFVDLEPLPQTIVEIEPEWEGYLYFLVGDEIVVVDPSSFEIVAVLPA